MFKFEKYRHYFKAYDKELAGLSPTSILEIGVHSGGSLYYWKERFPTAKILGLDIDPNCIGAEARGITVRIGDQSDKDYIEDLARIYGPFDLIVDDGGHWPYMQKASFEVLWCFLNPNGVYVIEDTHTSYWMKWGGFRRGFYRYIDKMIDQLHGYWNNNKTQITISLDRISIYDSIVFLHKSAVSKEKPELLSQGEGDCRKDTSIKSTAIPVLKWRIKRLFKTR